MSNKLKSVELFLALGLATAIGVSNHLVVNAEETDEPTITTHLIAQGGEGGEGGAELSPGEQANADLQDKLSGTELLNALQQGGHVIYFRHAQTEKDYADQVSAAMGDCSTQRMLSEEGWQQAKMIGAAFQENSIPVGQIISSEYCRAWQTADIAFGKYEKNPAPQGMAYVLKPNGNGSFEILANMLPEEWSQLASN
jgi:hypothetical protein